jgi:hypothetical protein
VLALIASPFELKTNPKIVQRNHQNDRNSQPHFILSKNPTVHGCSRNDLCACKAEAEEWPSKQARAKQLRDRPSESHDNKYPNPHVDHYIPRAALASFSLPAIRSEYPYLSSKRFTLYGVNVRSEIVPNNYCFADISAELFAASASFAEIAAVSAAVPQVGASLPSPQARGR